MKKKVILILPAYNASKTLVPFLKDIPKQILDDIILVDDYSTDGTHKLALGQKGIKVYQTPRNLGYGGNLKFCLSKALLEGADVIVELHPDREYEKDGILPALEKVKQGTLLVLGNRFGKKKTVGMFWWKYLPIQLLTWMDNVVLGTDIADMHQGFRVYTKELLEKIDVKRAHNDYIFSFEIIAQTAFERLSIANVPVTTRYYGKKRGASFRASIIYSLKTFLVLGRFILAKLGKNDSLFTRPIKIPVCPNCLTDGLVKQKIKGKFFSLYFCSMCRNGFTYPIPTNMSQHYPKSYWNASGMVGKIKERIFAFFQQRRVGWVKKYLSKGFIVDVGAGEGLFAQQMGEKFYVKSLEPLFSHVTNPSVVKTDFLLWNPRQGVDVITFWESLEHVADPKKYIQKTFTLLKKSGYLFIEYPRFSSIERKIFGMHWFHLDIPRHLAHFTDRGIVQLLTQNGFTVKEMLPVNALEYSVWGLFASIMSSIGIHFENKQKRVTLFFILLFLPLLIIVACIEMLTFLFGDSPIGLVVAQKK